ncbi:phenylacetate--CoA ligase family protein [Pseudoduganella armeniaca]|uniref:Phenylacetate--CoA ligase family protein n=1 Tax=Pseudoduganella armeniaca TaxID=2072590 RepID=A0A2R4C8M8_9BURK|nr:phenylacetate--CoA ligase family protein [Pseudoduganella armeniaca]AVR95977.1 hypothetical protein C9I28_09715 [Pseudoduganella armeniaca]
MDLAFEIKNFLKAKIRTGPRFQRALRRFTESAHLEGDALRDWQLQHLQRTIANAYQNVPFYKRLLDKEGIRPSDIRTLADMKRIPLTEKAHIRADPAGFINPRSRGFKFSVQTSGSTGTPLELKRDTPSIIAENAFLWRYWQQHGKRPGSRRATIRAGMVSGLDSDRLWVYNRHQNELLLSAFHLNDACLSKMVDKLQEFKAFDLYANPSTAYVLADYLARSGRALHFDAVFTSSEQLFDYQAELITTQMKTRIWDWYGQAERVSAIALCPHGHYHIQEDYSLTELEPIGDGQYEVIGTSFFNHLQPFIRYHTGDRVELQDEPCSCGSSWRPIRKISGRAASYIVAPDGRKISLVSHIPRGVPYLIEAQFVQDSPDDLRIRVVCEDQFSEREGAMLIARAKERISPDMNYRIEKLPMIPRTSSGKFMPIIPLGQQANQPQVNAEATV